ncbi:MAG: hypothetical protein LLG06_05040 [Desulfobacteraceae bacterium]|nr:hypothetical protein [Desulfobacteraceae bacterium]
MNYKLLGKYISQYGIWEKPLNEFTQEEVLKLAGAIAVAQCEDKTCGGCHYIGWKGLDLWCMHPDHPAKIHPYVWTTLCPEYSGMFDKELGPHKLNRKPRLQA